MLAFLKLQLHFQSKPRVPLKLPLDCALVLRSRPPLSYMLWKKYVALELFISLLKQPHFTFTTKEGAPNNQDLMHFQQLLLEPLWLNGLFLDPISHNPLIPFSKDVEILNFKHIWSIQQGSVHIPPHAVQCFTLCSHDQGCKFFWNTCISPNTIEFAAWCSQFQAPIISINDDLSAELVSFSLDITAPNGNQALTPLSDCTVKSLTAYFTANRAGPIDFGNITGLVGWARHWPMYADKFKWKEYFQLLTNNNIDKITRSAFWKLLHRSHIPRSKKPYAACKFCQLAHIDVPFSPEHSIFGCPRTKALWYQVFSYIQKIEPEFYQEITFMTVISLGLHNMNPNIRRPDTLVNAIHNIIGLGIMVLTAYPIESAESIESTFTRYRIVFKNFISNFICSKIESHIKNHGPNPVFFPVCRTTLASESALWLLLVDNTPASVLLPSWSDYTYCDPF